MSNMKNLLSGITFGDVELIHHMITEDFTETEYDNIFNTWELYGETTYEHWLKNYGRELSIKWVIDNNEPINEEWIIKYRTYVAKQFIEWVKSNVDK